MGARHSFTAYCHLDEQYSAHEGFLFFFFFCLDQKIYGRPLLKSYLVCSIP